MRVTDGERISIRYTPHNSNTPQELPLKLLVMGNFKGNAHPEADTPVGMRTPVAIDHTTFEKVMVAANISLKTRIDYYPKLRKRPNKQQAKPLDINLRFASLKDFNPDQIINQIPELRKQVILRDLLSV